MNECLLLNLNWRKMGKVGRMDKNTPVVPLEFLYISAGMEGRGIAHTFLDLWGLNQDVEDVKDSISAAGVIVVNTAPSYVFWRDGTLDTSFPKQEIRKIRDLNPAARLVLIGPHGTVRPEDFSTEPVDFLVQGEPDLVTVELVECLLQGKEYTLLPGVCYRKGPEWVSSQSPANVDNLCQLPLLKFRDLDLSRYNWPPPPPGISPRLSMGYEASRGCIFDCAFCFREGFRGKFRLKPLSSIRKELDALKEQGVEYIYFIDEIFAVDRAWTEQVCQALEERGIKWGCQTRPHLLNKEKIQFYAAHNCAKIEMGLEAVNARILKTLDKTGVNTETLRECIAEMIRCHIHPTLFCILGSPGESRETIREMLDYLTSLPLEKVEVNVDIMMPYPDTKLWKQANRQGLDFRGWEDVEKHMGIVDNAFSSVGEVKREFIVFLNTLSRERRKRELKLQLLQRDPASLLTLAKLAKSQALVVFPALNAWIDRLKAQVE